MITRIFSVYARAIDLVRRLPLVLLLPFAAELLQHKAEISLGMYAGAMDRHAQAIRLAYGAAKILALFLTLVTALRWWHFDGDLRRVFRPGRAMFTGLALVIFVQIAGDLAAAGVGGGLSALLGSAAPRGWRIAVMLVPFLAWLFVAGLLFPWYVGLLVEDRGMTLRRSVAAMRGRLTGAFVLLVAGFLPLMVLHYALGFGAMGRNGLALWAMMVIDAIVVAMLVIVLAAVYFEIYLRARRGQE